METIYCLSLVDLLESFHIQ